MTGKQSDTSVESQVVEPIADDEILTREALYELVWSEPMLKVAARFKVSSSFMARVCTQLNVPRPQRGYWAKLAVSKAPKRPALPEAGPGDSLEWSRGGGHLYQKRVLPTPPSIEQKRRPLPEKTLPDIHPLIVGAKPFFEAGRESFHAKYLKPAKKLLVDFAVSKSGLDNALSFANQLFLAFEARGHRVVIAPPSESFRRAAVDEHDPPRNHSVYNDLWSPLRCTVVYIGTVAVGLTIIELSEAVEVRYINGEYVRLRDYVPPKRSRAAWNDGWTSTRDLPTGRFCLQAYSPYLVANWTRQWRASKKRSLEGNIPAIVRGLEKDVIEVARLVEEGEIQAELDRRRRQEEFARWERAQAEKRAAEALNDSKEDLLAIIDVWAQANRIKEFFDDVEKRLEEIAETEQPTIRERLKRARDIVGSVDALEQFKSWEAPEDR